MEISYVNQKEFTCDRRRERLQTAKVCRRIERFFDQEVVLLRLSPFLQRRSTNRRWHLNAGRTGNGILQKENSGGIYICKSIVNDLRHGNYICKS